MTLEEVCAVDVQARRLRETLRRRIRFWKMARAYLALVADGGTGCAGIVAERFGCSKRLVYRAVAEVAEAARLGRAAQERRRHRCGRLAADA